MAVRRRTVVASLAAALALAAGAVIVASVVASRGPTTPIVPAIAPPALPALPAASATDGAYAADFRSAGVGTEWTFSPAAGATTRPTLTKAPADGSTFLGPFDSDSVTLALKDLPPHAFVRVALDLYVIHSWDGSQFRGSNGSPFGPDFWSMDLADAPGGRRRSLIRATFSNTDAAHGGFDLDGAVQSYPSPFSGDSVPAQSGSRAHGSLGYVHPEANDVREDAVYRIVFDAPHSAATLCLTFAGDGPGPGPDDDKWGVARIHVTTADTRGTLAAPADDGDPTFALPDPATLAAAFEDACDIDNERRAAEAFGRFVLGGDASVDVIRAANLPPLPPVDAADVRRQVDRLGDIGRTKKEFPPGWRVPDPTEEALVALGWPAEPLLAAIQAEGALPPLRANRLDQALRRIRVTPLGPGADRQRQIALRALAILDTPAARQLSATLSPPVR